MKEQMKFKTIEEQHGAPIGWFPTKPSNPSKLQAHKFVNGEWVPLSFVKFVPWPEAFPDRK
jgi:hypothetical protein